MGSGGEGDPAFCLLALAPVFGIRLGGGWRAWRIWIINTLFTFAIAYSGRCNGSHAMPNAPPPALPSAAPSTV